MGVERVQRMTIIGFTKLKLKLNFSEVKYKRNPSFGFGFGFGLRLRLIDVLAAVLGLAE